MTDKVVVGKGTADDDDRKNSPPILLEAKEISYEDQSKRFRQKETLIAAGVMDGKISSRNNSHHPSEYRQSSLSLQTRQGSPAGVAHQKSLHLESNNNDVPFNRRKMTTTKSPSPSSSSSPNNNKATIKKKTPFHGSTEVILKDKKNGGDDNDKKKSTNKAAAVSSSSVAAAAANTTPGTRRRSTGTLRRSPPSERKVPSKMFGTATITSLRRSLPSGKRSSPQKIIKTVTSPNSSRSTDSSNSSDIGNSILSKSSSTSTISTRLKLLNCFGQKQEGNDDDDDVFGFNDQISNKHKNETTTCIGRGRAKGEVPKVVNNNNDKIAQHQYGRSTASVIRGNINTNTNTNNNNKNTSVVSNAGAAAAAVASSAVSAATIIRSATRSTAINVSLPQVAGYPQHQQVTGTGTETEIANNTNTILSELKAEEETLQKLLLKLEKEEYQQEDCDDYDNVDDIYQMKKAGTDMHQRPQKNPITNLPPLTPSSYLPGHLIPSISKLSSSMNSSKMSSSTFSSIPPPPPPPLPPPLQPQLPVVGVDGATGHGKRQQQQPNIVRRSQAYALKQAQQHQQLQLQSKQKSAAVTISGLDNEGTHQRIAATTSVAKATTPQRPRGIVGSQRSSLNWRHRSLSSSHRPGLQSSNSNSVGYKALMSEYTSTVGAPLSFPTTMLSTTTTTTPMPTNSIAEDSTISGYSSNNCDYDDDIYSTDLSSFTGGDGGDGRSTITETSNSVVNMAAQTIAMRQREQLAQQQINGIIPRCHFCGEGHWIYNCPFMNPLSFKERDSFRERDTNYSTSAGYNDFTDNETDNDNDTDDETRRSDVFDTILEVDNDGGSSDEKDDNNTNDNDEEQVEKNDNIEAKNDDEEGDVSTQMLMGGPQNCHVASFDCFYDKKN